MLQTVHSVWVSQNATSYDIIHFMVEARLQMTGDGLATRKSSAYDMWENIDFWFFHILQYTLFEPQHT